MGSDGTFDKITTPSEASPKDKKAVNFGMSKTEKKAPEIFFFPGTLLYRYKATQEDAAY